MITLLQMSQSTAAETPAQTPTLYTWAGGRTALAALIDAFYDRVETDDLLGPLFGGP